MTNLCHVSDQVEGDVRESFVKIAAHHVDPGGAVSRVGVRFVQSHDMSEVGELGVLLLKADLHAKRASAAPNVIFLHFKHLLRFLD